MMRPGRTAVLSLGLLAALGCRSYSTRILDRPELPRAAVGRKAPEPLWVQRTGPPTDGHYFAAATGDLNGDGLPDLAAVSFEPGGISVWMAREDGTWQFGLVPLPASEARDILLVDVDGDGRDDVVAVSRGGIDGLLLLQIPEEGPWESPTIISSGSGYEAVAAGDIDGDGDLDLAAARGGGRDDGGIEVLLGDGHGGFHGGTAPLSAGSYRDVLLDDLDGDGRLDIVAAGWGLDEGIRLLWGDGHGGFRAGPVVGVPGHYRSLTLGDVTGDGKKDLVATTYREGVAVFPGLDPAADRCVLIDEGSFWSALLADGDGDGRPEVYATSSNGLGILAWRHERGCSFRRFDSGLPDRDVWYGLAAGQIRATGSAEIIAAGFTGGLQFFAPAHTPSPPESPGPLLSTLEGSAEDPYERGNDAFTTALGFDEYRLGVGDIVRVRVFNGSDVREIEATVQSDGEIFVPTPGIGSITASGVSPTQLKRALKARASDVWKDPEVEVVVIGHRAHTISLLGEVHTTNRPDSGPGQYPLKGKVRVVGFLSQHGGLTDRADLNRVQLIRPSGRSSYLNLYKAIFSSDQNENPILNDGDTLFVPSVSFSNRKVFVLGEVKHPGMLELRENLTLLEAITSAEGFTDKAVLKKILVIRGGLESPELLAVNLKDLLERGDMSANVLLRNGDVVYVPRRLIANVNEFFAAIQPALNLIETLFILNEVASD